MIKLFEQIQGLEEEFRGAKQELINQLESNLSNREIIFNEKRDDLDSESVDEIYRIIRLARGCINALDDLDTFIGYEVYSNGNFKLNKDEALNRYKSVMNYIRLLDKLLKDEEESE